MELFLVLSGLAFAGILVAVIRKAGHAPRPPHELPPLNDADTALQHQAIHAQHLHMQQAAHEQHMHTHHQAHQAAMDATMHTPGGCCDAGGHHPHH